MKNVPPTGAKYFNTCSRPVMLFGEVIELLGGGTIHGEFAAADPLTQLTAAMPPWAFWTLPPEPQVKINSSFHRLILAMKLYHSNWKVTQPLAGF